MSKAVPAWKYRNITPSILDPTLLACGVGFPTYTILHYIIMLPLPPGMRLIAALAFGFICSGIAFILLKKVVAFGGELRTFILLNPRAFWPIAFRVYGLHLALFLIGAPVVATVVLFTYDTDVHRGLLTATMTALNLVLLNLLYALAGAFILYLPPWRRYVKYFINALLPATAVGVSASGTSLLMLYLAAQAVRIVWKSASEQILRFFVGVERYAQDLTHWHPIGGRMLKYWLSPHLMLMQLVREPDGAEGALVAFAGATLLLCIAFWLIIRPLIYMDVETLLHAEVELGRTRISEVYAELDAKLARGLAEEAENDSAVSAPYNTSVTYGKMETPLRAKPESRSLSDLIGPGSKKLKQMRPVYVLPQDKAPEVFTVELWRTSNVWPRHGWWGVFAVACAVILTSYRNFTGLLPLLWLLITGYRQVPYTLSSAITPYKVWRQMGWRFKKYVLPFLPGDILAATLVPLVLTRHWWMIVPILLGLILFRPYLFLLSYSYLMQSALLVIASLGFGLIVLWGLALVIFAVPASEPVHTQDALFMLAVVVAPHVVLWALFAVLVKWKYNNLLHIDPKAPR